jgi:hypothetical protein
MPRHADRSMCCGAGGARMWMEEKIGKRVNLARTEEALGTEAKQIATGCPFCRVMLTDGLTEKQNEGVGEGVEVLDVSQMLLASVKRGDSAGNGQQANKADEPSAQAKPVNPAKPAESATKTESSESTDSDKPADSTDQPGSSDTTEPEPTADDKPSESSETAKPTETAQQTKPDKASMNGQAPETTRTEADG